MPSNNKAKDSNKASKKRRASSSLKRRELHDGRRSEVEASSEEVEEVNVRNPKKSVVIKSNGSSKSSSKTKKQKLSSDDKNKHEERSLSRSSSRRQPKEANEDDVTLNHTSRRSSTSDRGNKKRIYNEDVREEEEEEEDQVNEEERPSARRSIGEPIIFDSRLRTNRSIAPPVEETPLRKSAEKKTKKLAAKSPKRTKTSKSVKPKALNLKRRINKSSSTNGAAEEIMSETNEENGSVSRSQSRASENDPENTNSIQQRATVPVRKVRRYSSSHRNGILLADPPVLPLNKDGSISYPFKLGEFTVHSLGEIVSDRKNFHNSKYVFPVGFKVTCSVRSFKDTDIDVEYTCTILDGANPDTDAHLEGWDPQVHGDGPLFVVTASDAPDEPQFGTEVHDPWQMVDDLICRTNYRKEFQEEAPADVELTEMSKTSAIAHFGVSDDNIHYLLEELPGVDNCASYRFRFVS